MATITTHTHTKLSTDQGSLSRGQPVEKLLTYLSTVPSSRLSPEDIEAARERYPKVRGMRGSNYINIMVVNQDGTEIYFKCR